VIFLKVLNKTKRRDIMKTYDVWELLKIAESTNAPDEYPQDSPYWCGDKIFNAMDGWKVEIFYDCGELDCINYFINPEGEEINFWDWPDGDDFYNSDKNTLMCWRRIGDLERLQKAHSADAK
jgi:hypothetical protein